MATFGQWLNEQSDKPGETGWTADFWHQITPGRISSPTGMIRHMERELSGITDPDIRAQYERGIAGIRTANEEYGRAVIASQAERAGLRVVRDEPQAPDVQEQAVPARDELARHVRVQYELGSDATGPKIVPAGVLERELAAEKAALAAREDSGELSRVPPPTARERAEGQLDRIERKLDTVLAILKGSGLQALAATELSTALAEAVESAPDEPKMALWLKRDGSFDYGQLHLLADLAGARE